MGIQTQELSVFMTYYEAVTLPKLPLAVTIVLISLKTVLEFEVPPQPLLFY
jgi:hypothetical protein